jgi:hypothetical protein
MILLRNSDGNPIAFVCDLCSVTMTLYGHQAGVTAIDTMCPP